ncbi:MAG TPA: trigger factor [Myxococcaceae bacterium]|nr:trigger factor [Myxococcaceae bacterium]
MKVQVEELSPIERKLSIEVENAQVARELERAYSTLGRKVKIPGFRPGKVPRRILEQRFKEQVEDDVVQHIVEHAYMEAIREHHVDAVSHPQITNPSGLKAEAPFSFEARVEVRPKVEPKDYEALELKREELAVTDEQVSQQLERMRQTLARLEPIADRQVAQKGDWAQIDHDASVDGKPFAGSKAENITVEIAEGDLIKGNVAALEGMKIGEARDVEYTFPSDYPVVEIRGKAARYHIRLKGLKREVLPELDDAFARELQAGETLEQLRAKVRRDLERSAKRQAAQKEREQIIQRLVERNAFEVPRAMVDRAVEAMLRGALNAMAQRGVDPRYLQLDLDALRAEMRPTAEREVKGTLLLEAIADKHGIQAGEEDVEKKIAALAEESGAALSQVRRQFRDPESREALAMRLREEKTIEFLTSRAKY